MQSLLLSLRGLVLILFLVSVPAFAFLGWPNSGQMLGQTSGEPTDPHLGGTPYVTRREVLQEAPLYAPQVASNEQNWRSNSTQAVYNQDVTNTSPVPLPAAPETSHYVKQATVATQQEQLLLLENQLQTLGVQDYRLEPWGAGGHTFRFVCRVPATRHVSERICEGIDSDPVAAVKKGIWEIQAAQARRW